MVILAYKSGDYLSLRTDSQLLEAAVGDHKILVASHSAEVAIFGRLHQLRLPISNRDWFIPDSVV